MTQVKLSQDIYEKVRKIAEKSNRSIKEVVEEAIKIYLLGAEGIDKDVKGVQQKWISVQYPTSCRRCGKRLNPGDLAFWIKYTYSDNSTRSFVYCPDCYYTSFDQSLAKKFLKQKELEATIRGLKKEAERLAEEVNRLKQQYDILQLKEEVFKLYREFHSFLGESITSDEKLAKVNEFLERLQDVIDRLNRLEATLEHVMDLKPRKRRAEKTATVW